VLWLGLFAAAFRLSFSKTQALHPISLLGVVIQPRRGLLGRSASG